MRLSPDGRRVAVEIEDPGSVSSSIWLIRFPEGVPTRLCTAASDVEMSPVWSPDGTEIAYARARRATPNVVKVRVGDPDAEELVPSTGRVQWVSDWSPDGRTLLYAERDPSTWYDIWALEPGGDRKPVPWLQTRFKEIYAMFSPNGRWVAYTSDETGRYEIYVRPFRGAGEARRVSLGGGNGPVWRGDGKELYFVDLEEEPGIVAVGLDPSSAEVTSAPRTLFKVSSPVRDLEVTKDGERFLINAEAVTGRKPLAHVVVNWTAGLAR
jgi:Tol biopolymer transport system component